MKRTDRFNDLAEVRMELQRLDTVRKAHEDRLERHWQAVLDHDVRGRLLKDAANDVIRSWKPAHMLSKVFGGGSVGPSLLSAVTGRGGWFRKATMFALSMALPKILGKVNDVTVNDITREVQVSYQRFRDHLQARKAAKDAHLNDDDE
ncbi:MAG TPA: hypothetical protein VHL57_02160 [Flavobacteriales bacterium]|jgi:hypothetical protein|nr:hypothetical protein [Flavobacteriales bacterium]